QLAAAEIPHRECPEALQRLGGYFTKKAYVPAPLPKYEKLKAKLPSPVNDDHPLWIQAYWKTWELAFRNFHEPPPGSGFVSQFIDAAFGDNVSVYLWDSSFMTMFANYAGDLTPGIATLDNFYARQHEDGEICREMVHAT